MRKLLLAGTAVAVVMAAGAVNAADIAARPVYKAVPPAPAWSWTGWYIGVHVGAGWGTKEWSDPFFPGKGGVQFTDLALTSYGVNGFLGGGQIGYNYQTGPWVWGIEAQASWAGIRGRNNCGLFFGGKASCKTDVNALGTFAVRFGGTIDRALLYVKGGAAWAYEKHTMDFFAGKGGGISTSDKEWRWGAMVGGGVEFAFTSSVSGKLEYNYMDFGKRTYSFDLGTPGGPSFPFDAKIRQNLHVVKVGLNWRFNQPVVAKY